MDVIKQFDLEFDDLHACLNTWMSVSPTANDDLQQKRDHMTTAADGLKTSSGSYGSALATANELFGDLGKAATAGQGKVFESARLLDATFIESSSARDAAAKASIGQAGACAQENDAVRQAVADFEANLLKGFTQQTTTVAQSHEMLTAMDTACHTGHETVGKSLSSMKTTLVERGDGSAKQIGGHSTAIHENGNHILPTEFGKVSQWVSQDLQPGQVAIVAGVGQAASQAFVDFASAVNKVISQGGQDVTTALTTAGKECSTARQQLGQHVKTRTGPLLDEMGKAQRTNQSTFGDGFKNVQACAQRLGDLRGRFEAVRRNT